MESLLEVKNLSVSFYTKQGEVQAVRDVSFSLRQGETLAVAGESGCGKSVLCKSILKLLPDTARIKGGSIVLNGTDITGYTEKDMKKLRGRMFSMVLQDPMTSLNPAVSVGSQIAEAVRVHHPGMKKQEVYHRAAGLMELCGIDHSEERYGMYPGQFSGGMRQRSVLAAALASNPKILFADEPTTALDVTIQAQILDLLRDIQRKFRTAVVFVTHDLGAAARAADRIAVMYAGKIVEIGTAEEIFYDPRHPYTQGLLKSLPCHFLEKKDARLYTIPGMPPELLHPPRGDAFACRNAYALAVDYVKEPPMFPVTKTHAAASWLLDPRAANIKIPAENQHDGEKNIRAEAGGHPAKQAQTHKGVPEILLDVRHLVHEFYPDGKTAVRAVDDISFQIRKGEVFGLVGESGCGKSTTARCIMNIYRSTGGEIFYKGINVCDPKQFRRNRKMLQSTRQIIFQDSASSLNQRMKAVDIIAEPMVISKKSPPRGSYRAEAEFQMYYVGMDASNLDKYPPELSGGMRQRVAVARALSMEPEFLAADEPLASLDVSIQAQVMNLFKHLQEEHGFTFLFIAHDLSAVRYLCDRVGVMYRGKMIETAPAEELFQNPLHPYTKALLSAVPVPDPVLERRRKIQIFREQDFWREGKLCPAAPDHFVFQ